MDEGREKDVTTYLSTADWSSQYSQKKLDKSFVTARDNEGQTPLHWAVKDGK